MKTPPRPDQPAPRCPACGSADLERIGDKERRAIGRGRIGIIPIGTIGKTWECKSCWALF